MKKLKYPPYYEILDFYMEQKEYRKVCKRKSTKHRNYYQWRQYIVSRIARISSREDWMNFKHFVINKKRMSEMSNKINFPLMTCTISILFASFSNTVDDTIGPSLHIIALAIALIGCLIPIIRDYYSNNLSYLFYEDLLKIIEEVERDKFKTHSSSLA